MGMLKGDIGHWFQVKALLDLRADTIALVKQAVSHNARLMSW